MTISKTSHEDLKVLGIYEDNISIINPGVNSELFHPQNKTENPSLVYYGGMREYKRPEEALFLLKELLKEMNTIKLIIIGEGPSKPRLEHLSIKMGIGDHVEFTGRISDNEVSEIVANSWLNIHSSVTEGWGISIIEAASAGTPTIAYRVPGVSDSIENGLNGITVEDGDRKALVNATLVILKDPNKWCSSSIEVARKYSWDKTAELWEDLIHKVALKNDSTKKNSE